MKNLLKRRGYRTGQIVVLTIAAFLAPACGYAKAKPAKSKSECITCHTDIERIIRLSSEIDKTRPKLGKSAETLGEG